MIARNKTNAVKLRGLLETREERDENVFLILIQLKKKYVS